MGGDGAGWEWGEPNPQHQPIPLGTKFILIPTRIPSQTGVKQVEMGWRWDGYLVRPAPLPSLFST